MRIKDSRQHVGAVLLVTGLVAASGVAAAVTGPPAFGINPSLGPGQLVAAAAEIPAVDLPHGEISETASQDPIRALQQRLTWTGATTVSMTGEWDEATTNAVRRFQAKQHLHRTGHADAQTVETLRAVAGDGSLDPQCMKPGITLCVNKEQKVLRYVQDQRVLITLDINTGPEKGDKWFGQYSATRLGSFHVFHKAKFEVSNEYGTPLPWFMQFDNGIGFHYSEFFRTEGYNNSSYGCVTTNNKDGLGWVFRHTPLNTSVIVYNTDSA